MAAHTLKTAFNSDELDQLQWIFDSVWTTIKAHLDPDDPRDDEKLKSDLRRQLFGIVCKEGLKDQEALRSHLLSNLALAPRSASL